MSVALTESGINANQYFTEEESIVREIWGKSDTILVVFTGAAAEFALSKAVDWLYFTGRLPADPLGRLFSTVSYAQKIVFSREIDAFRAIDTITSAHQGVETQRGYQIPDWAYRDVLFMLIDYSIRAYELLERPLTQSEKSEILYVFNRLGNRMKIKAIPTHFGAWQKMREDHLQEHLKYSDYTADLFLQYKKHLGAFRYSLLLELQGMIVPARVHKLMNFRKTSLIKPLISSYKLSRSLKMDWMIKTLLFPKAYKEQIKSLDFH